MGVFISFAFLLMFLALVGPSIKGWIVSTLISGLLSFISLSLELSLLSSALLSADAPVLCLFVNFKIQSIENWRFYLIIYYNQSFLKQNMLLQSFPI